MPKYDVAVIGAGLGGLAAAALLSSRKKRTIVIEQGASLSDAWGVFEKDGFVFSGGPALSYGFERGGLLQQLSTDLGIVQHLSVRSPCYQVALPDRRVAVYAEPNETLEELTREFRNERDAVSKFYHDIDTITKRIAKNRVYAYLSRYRSAAGFFRKYRFSRGLTAFFDIQSLFFFQKPAADLSLATLATFCSMPPHHLSGGFRTLGDQLHGVILRHGGEVRYNEQSAALSFRDNGIITIKTSQGSVETDSILLNILPHRHRSRLFVGLCDTVVPIGMSSTVLYLPEYSRPYDFFAVSLNTAEDDGAAPEGMKALTVSFPSLQNEPVDKQGLVEHLGRLIPFLNEYLVFAEESKPGVGHTVLPADITLKPLRSHEDTPFICKTSRKKVSVLHDAPEAPLQVLSAVQRYVENLA